jgi:hypothetical protein
VTGGSLIPIKDGDHEYQQLKVSVAIKFLDSQTWELRRTLRGAMYRIFSLFFSPDGETLASCVGPNLPAITGQFERLTTNLPIILTACSPPIDILYEKIYL